MPEEIHVDYVFNPIIHDAINWKMLKEISATSTVAKCYTANQTSMKRSFPVENSKSTKFLSTRFVTYSSLVEYLSTRFTSTKHGTDFSCITTDQLGPYLPKMERSSLVEQQIN